MKKELFAECEHIRYTYRHGGRAVLHVQAELPQGESALHAHVRAMVSALCGFAERELLPEACRLLEEAVQAGKGYSFAAHRYRITLKTDTVRGLLAVKLVATLQKGARQEECDRRELIGFWTRDGALQRPAPRHHRRAAQKAGERAIRQV